MRGRLALGLAAGTIFLPAPALAWMCPGSIAILTYDVRSSEGYTCHDDGPIVAYGPEHVTSIDCRTGREAPVLPYTCAALAIGEIDWAHYQHPGCIDSAPSSFVINRCEGKGLPPAPGRPRSDKCADPRVGDPVDVTTGALSQDVTDIDLGSGLEFRRHYASDAHPSSVPPEDIPPLGRKWSHGLAWKLERRNIAGGWGTAFVIRRPLRDPAVFFQPFYDSRFVSDINDAGSLSTDSSHSVYTDGDGTTVTFDAADKVAAISKPGQAPIAVTYGSSTQTFTRGGKSLTITTAASGPNAGRIASVSGGGAVFTYVYDADQVLDEVHGPDPATLSSTDEAVWHYGYRMTAKAEALLERVERTAGGQTKVLGEWTYDPVTNRVSRADELALELPVRLGYATIAGEPVTTVTADETSHVYATFSYSDGKIVGTTGLGAPGLSLHTRAATLQPNTSVAGSSTFADQWRTRTDLDGHTTLFESYARDGAPGRVVEGWVESATDGGIGVFSSGDGYARLREFTWHPQILEPLTISEPSPLASNALEKVTTFDYVDPVSGALTTRRYRRIDAGNTLSAAGEPIGYAYETRFTYDAAGRIETVSGPRIGKNYTVFTYDPGSGFRTSMRRHVDGPESPYLETAYSNFDARGNPQTVTDPNGRATGFTYDEADRIRTVTPPWSGAGSATIGFEYDASGNLVRVDFPADSFGNPSFLRMGYTEKNHLESVAAASGDALVFEWSSGRKQVEARYSGFSSMASRGTLRGKRELRYDAAGRLEREYNPLFPIDPVDGVFTRYTRTDGGLASSIEDENGRVDNLAYNALQQLKQIDELRGGQTYSTAFGYDALANVSGITDPAARTTDYRRDDLGRVVELTSPDTGVTRYLYDEAGNLVTRIENAAGSPTRTTHYAYDGLDRLTHIDYPGDPDWVITYDTDAGKNQKGRLASVTNGLVTTAYEYTPRGEVALERTTIDGAIYDVTTTYDAAGNVRTLTGPSGIATTTDYLGQRPRTVSITGGAAPQAITDLEFYPFGPRTRALLPPYSQDAHANVVTSERSYNLRGQVEHVAVTGPAGLAVLDLTYAYDLTGGGAAPDDPGPDLDRVIDGRDGTQSRLYRYDPLGRLSEAEDLSGAPLFGYGYDAAGNRISSAGPAGSLGYGYEAGSNRLSERTIGTNVLTHYHHDAYGSRDYAGSLPYTTTPTYVYNQAGRIASVTGQLPTPSYTYDAFGRRIKKTASGITTLFFYDAQGRLLEEIAAPAMTGSPVRRYVFVEDELLGIASETRPVGAPAWSAPLVPGWLRPEPGAVIFVIALGLVVLTVPLVRRRPLAAVPVVLVAALSLGDSCPSPPPSFAAVHTDALGTPLAVTATTAASPTSPVVLWRASYEPFGAATVNEDPDNDGHGFTLNVRLPGQYYDFETGLHYNYFRTYDPATGPPTARTPKTEPSALPTFKDPIPGNP